VAAVGRLNERTSRTIREGVRSILHVAIAVHGGADEAAAGVHIASMLGRDGEPAVPPSQEVLVQIR
jgi:hypothetical protein